MDSQKMGRDWHHLPPELLEFIHKKVTSLSDYIRFCAVCRPWQNACCLGCPDHLPLQLPWLMLPYQIDGNDDSSSTRLFYDLAASKIRKLDLPETHRVSICGSSHGWFVLQKGQVVSLLNPITRATISLPLFNGTPSHIGIAPPHSDNFFENWEDDQYAINPTDNFRVRKAILTSTPQDPSCIVFVLSSSKWQLAFCKIGDECWKVIEFEYNITAFISDMTYSNGLLYAVCPLAAFTMYNFNNRSRTLLGDDGLFHDNRERGLPLFHLVEGVSGDILLIQDSRTFVNHKVYKLSNDGEPVWIEVIDVGQNVLFLGSCGNALCLSTANLQLPEWGVNCLCYDSVRTEKNRQKSWDPWYNHNIKLARLDNGMVTDRTGDLGSFQINVHWQSSLWLTPSLL